MLELTPAVRDAVVEHAREGTPEEVCGVLGGVREGDGGEDRATATRRVPNVAPTPETRYAMDPEAQLAAIDGLEAEGQDVVGFYHSHPHGPTGPSATDAARATWPGYVYLVVSLASAEPELLAFRWAGEAFESEPVRVVDAEGAGE